MILNSGLMTYQHLYPIPEKGRHGTGEPIDERKDREEEDERKSKKVQKKN